MFENRQKEIQMAVCMEVLFSTCSCPNNYRIGNVGCVFLGAIFLEVLTKREANLTNSGHYCLLQQKFGLPLWLFGVYFCCCPTSFPCLQSNTNENFLLQAKQNHLRM